MLQNRGPFGFQTGGPFGPMATTPGHYTRPANPWVHTNPQFSIGALPDGNIPTSMTLAGHEDSCCSGCAHSHRQGK